MDPLLRRERAAGIDRHAKHHDVRSAQRHTQGLARSRAPVVDRPPADRILPRRARRPGKRPRYSAFAPGPSPSAPASSDFRTSGSRTPRPASRLPPPRRTGVRAFVVAGVWRDTLSKDRLPFAFMPSLVVVAGPNGSGKSTTAPTLLRDTLKVDEFVNADAIAAGLSAFSPD